MRIVLKDLPLDVYGFVREDVEGFQTIVLNSRYNFETEKETFLHEIKHKDDFNKEYDVDQLEAKRE